MMLHINLLMVGCHDYVVSLSLSLTVKHPGCFMSASAPVDDVRSCDVLDHENGDRGSMQHFPHLTEKL